MDDQERLLKERSLSAKGSVKLRITSLLSLLCFALAVVTLVPWGASIPSHLGYYSVCSFAPISTVMLLALGVGILYYGRGHQRALIASAIVLVMLVGFSWVWAYTEKMPISNLQLRIRETNVYQTSGLHRWTVVGFNLTFYNPTDVDTPAFDIESFDILINGTRLVPFTYDWAPGGWYFDIRYILSGEIVRAHQTKTYSLELYVYWNWTKTEGGDLDTVLLALNQSKFSLTFSGLIVVRTWYITSPESTPGLLVAAAPFKVSFTYP